MAVYWLFIVLKKDCDSVARKVLYNIFVKVSTSVKLLRVEITYPFKKCGKVER
jgi:hypothetical protein